MGDFQNHLYAFTPTHYMCLCSNIEIIHYLLYSLSLYGTKNTLEFPQLLLPLCIVATFPTLAQMYMSGQYIYNVYLF